jgi:two-component system invasion response regulator UvrY
VAQLVPVLVVDDHPGFRAAARALIDGSDGFTMAGEAETGEQAVTLATAVRPGLVLMDLRLPGIDGIEATRRLLAAAPDTVVVLCSTYQPADLPESASSCGAVGYVRKEDLGVISLRSLWEVSSGR